MWTWAVLSQLCFVYLFMCLTAQLAMLPVLGALEHRIPYLTMSVSKLRSSPVVFLFDFLSFFSGPSPPFFPISFFKEQNEQRSLCVALPVASIAHVATPLELKLDVRSRARPRPAAPNRHLVRVKGRDKSTSRSPSQRGPPRRIGDNYGDCGSWVLCTHRKKKEGGGGEERGRAQYRVRRMAFHCLRNS